MSIPIVNSAEDQARRLRHKSQDARLAHLAVEGAGISPWEADVLVDFALHLVAVLHRGGG
jgi:hypothetical protein